ncbi:GFA family protein [Pseudooceanicola nanhaiensis]|uniref:GFA family protein n=1 Tax=Pseudooceanicola nanhaiensis TaxID=375761 RepID=UPI004057CE59
MSERQGGCMCGAVRFTATDVPAGFGACHCEMCRRWTGSAMLAVSVPEVSVTWAGAAQIRTLQSSEWAERAWCGRCGTGLYYRLTTEGASTIEIPVGLIDDMSGMEFRREIWIDHKPDAFAFAGERERLTREEAMDRFGPAEDAI